MTKKKFIPQENQAAWHGAPLQIENVIDLIKTIDIKYIQADMSKDPRALKDYFTYIVALHSNVDCILTDEDREKYRTHITKILKVKKRIVKELNSELYYQILDTFHNFDLELRDRYQDFSLLYLFKRKREANGIMAQLEKYELKEEKKDSEYKSEITNFMEGVL